MKRGIPFGFLVLSTLFVGSALSWATVQAQSPPGSTLKVLAVETFLADIAQNVAGDRIKVASLLPIGADPHSFQPTPAEVASVADCSVLIIHGAGIEEFLDEVLHNAGGSRRIIEASAGLKPRTPKDGEEAEAEAHRHEKEAAPPPRQSPGSRRDHKHKEAGKHGTAHDHDEEHHHDETHYDSRHHHDMDPHFWLSPVQAITYVTNIRDGLSQADPARAAVYAANADAYIAQLNDLDRWISEQVKQVPEAKRILVTNHESFGYFADRYGFRIVGSILPSVSTGASPSARELAELTKKIKAAKVGAIFLETGNNPQLARQLAKETGIKAVTELHTHSITEPGGSAPTYIEMMKFNTSAIVNALK